MTSHREFHTRAAAEVGDDFKRQHRELLQGQGLQFSASWSQREIDSFAANRAEAIRHHAGHIQEINGRETKAAIELTTKHDSLAGRLSALGKKGKARQEQEQERQALTEKFENERMKQHRDLAARQERQVEKEQNARLRYGMELKTMREGHVSARSTQRGWQDNNRPLPCGGA